MNRPGCVGQIPKDNRPLRLDGLGYRRHIPHATVSIINVAENNNGRIMGQARRVGCLIEIADLNITPQLSQALCHVGIGGEVVSLSQNNPSFRPKVQGCGQAFKQVNAGAITDGNLSDAHTKQGGQTITNS